MKFDPNMTEEDNFNKNETIESLLGRIDGIIHQLAYSSIHNIQNSCDRENEKVALIVSHGVWMEYCFMKYSPEVLEHGKRRVYNSELFSAELVSIWESKGSLDWTCISYALQNTKLCVPTM